MQKQHLMEIHHQANLTYSEGGDEFIVLIFTLLMEDLKKIMDFSSQKELNENWAKY